MDMTTRCIQDDAMVFGFRRQSGSGVAPVGSILDLDSGVETAKERGSSGGGLSNIKRVLSFSRKSRTTYDGGSVLTPTPPPPRPPRPSAPGHRTAHSSSDDDSDDDGPICDPAFPQGMNQSRQDDEELAYYEAAQRSSAPCVTRVVKVQPRQSLPGTLPTSITSTCTAIAPPSLQTRASLTSTSQPTEEQQLKPTPPADYVPAIPSHTSQYAPLSLDSLTLGHVDVISASSSGMGGTSMRATFRLSSDGSSAGGAFPGSGLSGAARSSLFTRDTCGRRSVNGRSSVLPNVQDSPHKQQLQRIF